jgi:8-oxo-dGTP pyrophosphatase MutT (NUDIX family)
MKNQLLKEYVEEVLEGIFYLKDRERGSASAKDLMRSFFTKTTNINDVVDGWLEMAEEIYGVEVKDDLESDIRNYASEKYKEFFRRSGGDQKVTRKLLSRALKKKFHSRLKSSPLLEMDSDFSMSGLRRYEAPGNIRNAQSVRSLNSSLEKDLASEEVPAVDGASIVLVTSGNKVLAVSRGGDIKNMNMPGGGIEVGETPEDAAARELYEETGIVADKLVYLCKQKMGEKNIYFFRAVKFSGQLTSSHEGIAKWEDPETLLRSQYGDSFRKVLQCIQGDKLTL